MVSADPLLLGAINQAGAMYRLDVRVIDVRTGEISDAAKVSRPTNEVLEMIPYIAEKLNRLTTPVSKPNKIIRPKPVLAKRDNRKTAVLHFSFKVTLGLFTERVAPVQLVRIYIDDELITTSVPINKINHCFIIAQMKVNQWRFNLGYYKFMQMKIRHIILNIIWRLELVEIIFQNLK